MYCIISTSVERKYEAMGAAKDSLSKCSAEVESCNKICSKFFFSFEDHSLAVASRASSATSHNRSG
jgi:hypothetical protein